MSDKIEEIRARHELVGGSGSVIHPTGLIWTIPGWVAHADRATLLAEVDKLRVEIKRLLQAIGLATTAVPDMVVDVTDPIGMMQRVVAEVDRLRTDLATQRGCCDGAAAQDAHVRQEREERRAEVDRLRAALYKIAGKVPFADDPWTIARKALDRREGR